MLKGVYEVTHGFTNTICMLYRQQAEGGAPEDDDLVAAQYTGPKTSLRQINQAILSTVQAFGDDVEIASKKTYVSLRRKKQFAIVQASTKDRVDLELNLKEFDATERLDVGNVLSGMCTHRVRLSRPENVDDEVAAWLHQAYEQA